MNWKDCFIALNVKYLELYEANPEQFFSHMANLKSVTGSVMEIYGILRKEGALEPMESISEAEKIKFYNEAFRLSSDKSKKHLGRVMKCLYTLSIINQ